MSDGGAHLELFERFISRPFGDGGELAKLMAWMKPIVRDGEAASASEAERGAIGDVMRWFPRLLLPDLDYTTATSFARILARLRKKVPPRAGGPRIAVVGSFTTHQLVELFDLYLHGAGTDAVLYEAGYGTLHQELLDPDSGLNKFRPDLVIILTTWRDLAHRPSLTDDRAAVQARVDAEVEDWRRIWDAAHRGLGCQIIQNNFDAPPWRTLGNLEARHPGGFGRYVSLVNHSLQEAAPAHVSIHDVDDLAATSGRWAWSDDRFYHHAKLPCAPESLVAYAHSLASLVSAHVGAAKKCLVLDLDNTLWGGVIGDDGLGGIRVGQGDPDGEAYLAFQRYVKELGQRGVILAVCSKNTDAIAREPFEKHSEMVLRMDDIACFVANWDDKATNIGRIASELNIGLSSLVFVDDSPVERSIIRRLQPEVAVPEMPDDPAHYVRVLDRHRYFQALTVSAEDMRRTELYKAEGARKVLESSTTDLDAFLSSLELVADIRPIDADTLARTVQLISRSNQFNLTTRRYSNADILTMIDDPAWVTRVISLRDRFGDNGLISVLLAKQSGDALTIDTWLMSCRVLKRGVERLALNHLVACARQRGLRKLLGEFVPTAKNALVRDHYASLGFTQIDGDDAGKTYWSLTVDDSLSPLSHPIRETAAHE
jgi:FkbH-like protein